MEPSTIFADIAHHSEKEMIEHLLASPDWLVGEAFIDGGAPEGAASDVDELDEVGRADEDDTGVEGVGVGLLSEGTVDLLLLFFGAALDEPEAERQMAIGVICITQNRIETE